MTTATVHAADLALAAPPRPASVTRRSRTFTHDDMIAAATCATC